MAAEEEESTVTMNDVLQKQLELEEEVAAKMQENWGDEKYVIHAHEHHYIYFFSISSTLTCSHQFALFLSSLCTYEQGYITQPIYACRTCFDKSGKHFGFCFGCSMNCHVDHDIYELFDKRHFKCDCGTPKSG